MPKPTTIYLDWNRPLLPAITNRLLASTGGICIDLSSDLVIVPTVQSGRRLREALALAASDRGLLPPHIVTPDVLLEQAIQGQPIASEESVTAAWVSVLGKIDCSRFNALFPIVPEPHINWQLGMAQRLMQLRNELGEEGLDFALAAQRIGASGHEPERWRELAQLEALYLDQLETRKLKDPKLARRTAAQHYRTPAPIKRIILAATPDPQALPLQALDQAAKTTPVEVWVYGPEKAAFDQWGRPLADHWSQRALAFEAWDCNLKPVATTKVTATWITAALQDAAPESVLLGLADPRLNSIILDAFKQAQIPCYDPEGQSLHLGGVGRLTELLCQACEDPNTSTIRTLLQHPDVQAWLNVPHKGTPCLEQLDRLFEDHLAADLATLIQFAARQPCHARLHNALVELQQQVATLTATRNFPVALAQVLQTIYANKQIQPSAPAGIPWQEGAEVIRTRLVHATEALRLFPDLSNTLIRSAFHHSLRRSRVYPDRPPGAHNLLGWLELLWNDAPHLILAGLNEGIVPESVIDDAFLPEALRAQLGLRTNAQRFARDAYLIEALCRRRAGRSGQIDILIPQFAADHSPLKPSRLLFQGSPDSVVRRTRQLFQESEEPVAAIKYHAAWKLSPPADLKLPASLPVSAFKSYLQCPFRFFLRHILQMRPVDVDTRELNPAAFGSLLHDILAKLKQQKLDRHCDHATLIKKLRRIAEQTLKHRYGNQLSFALRLQHEALIARIIAFCERQVEDIAAKGSCIILNTEECFEIPLNGMTVKGRIDRIDQRGEGLELIDYKTGNQASTPEKAHLAVVASKAPPDHLPKTALFEHANKIYRWTDLQLPLYRLAKQEKGMQRPSLAYFNLGQTLEKSGFVRWEEFTDAHLASAKACASAIIEKIQAGVFWPPSQTIHQAYDEFAPLFPDGIEHSVDAEAFMNYAFDTSTSIHT